MNLPVLLVLIILSMFFSVAETALTTVSRLRVKQLLEKKAAGARILAKLKENPSRMLSTILFGNNLANIAASALATVMVAFWLENLGLYQAALAVGLATGLMTFVILIFGEIIPKTVALKRAENIALFTAPLIVFLGFILSPVIWALDMVCRPFITFFGGVKGKGPFLTEAEIKTVLSMGEEEGVIEEDEKEMIHSIFEFSDTAAKEVMTPRPDMVCLKLSDPISAVIEIVAAQGHSRIPVYEGNLDNILGVVYSKDLIRPENREKKLSEIIRPALFVPESRKLDDLLHQMQAAKTHLAIIVDEYGGVAGLVSLEDLLEEIVGEIQDEFDREEKTLEFIDVNSALVDARLSLDDFNDKFKNIGLKIPEGDYDTIGGFVLTRLKKMPAVGDKVAVGIFTIIIEKILKRRITRIKIIKLDAGFKEIEGVGG